MDEPRTDIRVEEARERAEAALGWIDDDATAAVGVSPGWAEQACEELSAASVTGSLLGARTAAS